MVNTPVFKLLCLTSLVWGAMFYSSIASTVAIWLRSETFTHCFIILPICIYLIKLKWPALKSASITPNYWGLLAIVGALIIWLFGDLAKLLVIEQAAAFLMLPLMIWTLMGNQIGRLLIFPFAFWMFSVPVGEFLVPQLQNLTADITVWFLQLTGIPVYRNGLYIEVPNGLFEVAVACSGIRYLIASFTLGTLFAYLNYHSNKKRIIFILFSLILPLLANGIRAYGIVMIAYLSDMKYATGVDHLVYGWFFFGVVIFVMFAVGSIWSDPVSKIEQSTTDLPVSNLLKSKLMGAALSILLLIGLTFSYQNLVKNPNSEFSPDIASIFPNSQPLMDESWLPIFDNADLKVHGSSEGVDYFVAYYAVNQQGKELINSNNKAYNFKLWTLQQQAENEQFKSLTITNAYGHKRLLAYTYVTPWVTSPSGLKIKFAQAMDALLGRAPLGLFVMISMSVKTELPDSEAFLAEAELRLNSHLQDALNAQP